jgi:hypothetical protein
LEALLYKVFFSPWFDSQVVLPFLDSILTQGQLDGEGARGSCAGISNLLSTIVSFIKDNVSDFAIRAPKLISYL